MYGIAGIKGNDGATLLDMSNFDSFFASHSTSKKLWNSNIPYGSRYAKFYASS